MLDAGSKMCPIVTGFGLGAQKNINFSIMAKII